MILVTQGHPRGIGLEVFIKSFLCLSPQKQAYIQLHCSQEVLKSHLELMGLKHQTFDQYTIIGSSKLNCCWVDDQQSVLGSLDSCLKRINNQSVLLTLPSDKASLSTKNEKYTGYTDYLRKFYHKNLAMNFINQKQRLTLLTEHIPLSHVENINTDDVYKKIELTIDSYQKIDCLPKIRRVIITGINPHAGEDGLISNTDDKIKQAISLLKKKFSLEFLGPVPGDTIGLMTTSLEDLIISPFHDQGLTFFKTRYHLNGVNLTLGLDFLRISPDHGTAFDISSKNIANYKGVMECLKFALCYLRNEKY